jgi:hypothetical protein
MMMMMMMMMMHIMTTPPLIAHSATSPITYINQISARGFALPHNCSRIAGFVQKIIRMDTDDLLLESWGESDV